MSLSEPAKIPQAKGFQIPEAYFSSPDLAQRADLLRHLTENSNLIPLVRGVEGIGKSAFIGRLLDLAPQNWVPVEIIADVMLQPEALLAKLARTFGLNDAAEGLLESLALHFDHLRQDGFLPVIVVDDAHLLPEDSIVTLLRLHQQGANDNPLAQILLFAQPEIDNLLKTPQLKVMNLQLLQLLDMPLFTREQTVHFLEHLLAANESIPLSLVQAEKIFRETKGMPGHIKRRAIELTGSTEVREKTFDIREYVPTRAAIGGGIALLVVLLGLIYQDSINSMFASSDGAPEPGQSEPVPAGTTQPLALPSPTAESGSEPEVEVGARLTSHHPTSAADMAPGVEPPGKTASVADADQAPLVAELGIGKQLIHDEPAQAQVKTELTAETVAAPKLAEVPEPDMVEQKEMEPEQAVTVGQEDSTAAKVAAPPSDQSASTATPSVAKPEPKTKMPEVATDEVVVVSEQSKAKVPDVKPQAKPVTPKVEKPAVSIKTDTKPARTKVETLAVKGEAGVKSPVVRSDGRAGVQARAAAPVEERSTLLVEKEVPAVKLTQKQEIRTGSSLVAGDRRLPRKVQKNGLSVPLREDWLLKQRPSSYTIQLVGLQAEQGISSFLRRHSVAGRVAYYRTKRNGKPWFPVLFELFSDRKMATQAKDELPESLRKSGVWLRTIGSVQKEIRAR